MRKRLFVTMFITLGLLGCEPRHPDLYLPVGHPANPDSAAGRAIGAPEALRPEMTRVEVTAANPAVQAPNAFSPTDRRRSSAGSDKH
ncbi:MAG: hypothetical protein KKB37_05800 [Alphaproteobacteria bacterium]|nr:hypothetical protein [Alphaproteobacteria bacterium]